MIRLRLKQIRENRGLTQKALSDHLKAKGMYLSRVTICNLESGKAIRFDTIDRLCTGLEIMPFELFEFERD